jgi:N-acetylglutamate synthase-like GNAT family acetyltransferase
MKGIEPKLQDIIRDCIVPECRKAFIITPSEQRFFEKMGYPLPKRCPLHRAGKSKSNQV